jgi:hypothetical protein
MLLWEMEEGMGRLVDLQKADYTLRNATFIAKLPRIPSAEEWLTESDVLYKSEKGEFFYYVMTGLQHQLQEHVRSCRWPGPTRKAFPRDVIHVFTGGHPDAYRRFDRSGWQRLGGEQLECPRWSSWQSSSLSHLHLGWKVGLQSSMGVTAPVTPPRMGKVQRY